MAVGTQQSFLRLRRKNCHLSSVFPIFPISVSARRFFFSGEIFSRDIFLLDSESPRAYSKHQTHIPASTNLLLTSCGEVARRFLRLDGSRSKENANNTQPLVTSKHSILIASPASCKYYKKIGRKAKSMINISRDPQSVSN